MYQHYEALFQSKKNEMEKAATSAKLIKIFREEAIIQTSENKERTHSIECCVA